MRQCFILSVLVVLLATVAAACGWAERAATPTPTFMPFPTATSTPTPTHTPPALPSVDEVVANVAVALQELTTWRVDLGMDMDFEASGPEGGHVTWSMKKRSAIDLPDRGMEMDMSISVVAPGEEMEMQTALYLTGDTLYVRTNTPGMEQQWTKETLSDAEIEALWETLASTLFPGLQADLLEAFQLEVRGVREEGGVSCYLLEGSPDMQALFKRPSGAVVEDDDLYALTVFGGLMRLGLGMGMDPTQALPFGVSEMLQDTRFSYWIARDSYNLVHSEMRATVSIEVEGTEVEGDIEITSWFYSYGEEVSIDLPPEAEEAMEMPGS